MNYPKKIEITIENDAQAAILYSCFNRSIADVIANMGESVNEKVKKMAIYFEEATNKLDASYYIDSCWKTVRDMLPDTLTVPKFSVLLAALEKSGLTKKVVNKKKSKNNIAKIVVEMSSHNDKECVKILGFKNIKHCNSLPPRYFKNYPRFFIIADNVLKLSFLDSMNVVKTHTFRIGDFCNRTEFEIFLGLMKEAGKRLTQINKEAKQLLISKSTVVVKEFSI